MPGPRGFAADPTGLVSIVPLMTSTTSSPAVDVYIFRAALQGVRGVSRKLAIRTDKTLVDLHQLIQLAFDWDDDHLYAFWLSGKFWDRQADAFGRPDVCRDSGDRSAEVKLDQLALQVGQTLAYVFDFGDQWHVRLKLVEGVATGGAAVSPILDSRGKPPPQYGWNAADVA
jgi:hypothetical protein